MVIHMDARAGKLFQLEQTPKTAIERLKFILARHHNAIQLQGGDKYPLQKCELVREILVIEAEKALARQNEASGIEHIINTIPETLTLDEKLTYLSNRLTQFPARPVLTAHPTMVYTEEALQKIHLITQLVLLIDQPNLNPTVRVKAINTMNSATLYLIEHAMIPEKCLTPSEEAKRALFIYQNMIECYPSFLTSITHLFIKKHGGKFELVKQRLTPAAMASFREIGSWVKGDTDGNPNVTAQTKAQTIPDEQRAIITVYIKQLNEIIDNTKDTEQHTKTQKTLQSIVDYLQRTLNAVDAHIWFSVEESEKQKNRILHQLESILTNQILPVALIEKIQSLKDVIQLVGLAGGMKEFVRQTTNVNDAVFNEIISALAVYHIEIEDILTNNKADYYQQLPDEEKYKVHKLLCQNPIYFLTLKKYRYQFAKFSDDTTKEIDRLLFILDHKDIFSDYIYSDTKSPLNFDEVRILTWLAAFLKDKLRIGDINQHPFFNIPLCETPEDIKKIGNIIRAMLDNPHMRIKIIEKGYISYVGGPSDLGKTGGIMTHIDLVLAQMQIEDILKEYQARHPELAHVTVRVLHGFGGDMKRRIGANRQLHSTHQGAAAYYTLGAPGAYHQFLHRVAGQPSEADNKVNELRALKDKHPAHFHALIRMKDSCIASFQEFINSPQSGELLSILTYPELERKMNTSSRAASKDAKKSDPSKARAIGVLNHYTLAGVHADYFMGLVGINKLSQEDLEMLPALFSQLTVLQDIVYKTIYTIACSDFTRARKKLKPDNYHMLDEWESKAISVLFSITNFVDKDTAIKARAYLEQATTQPGTVIDLNHIAIELMKIMGNGFSTLAKEVEKNKPHYQRLSRCLEDYRQHPSVQTEENAILACRGIRPMTEGPDFISELKSPLGLALTPKEMKQEPAKPVSMAKL